MRRLGATLPRVPSHGTHFLGQTFAMDFVAIDPRRRTATVRDWRIDLAAVVMVLGPVVPNEQHLPSLDASNHDQRR